MNKGNKRKMMTFTLDEYTAEKLRQRAGALGISISGYLRLLARVELDVQIKVSQNMIQESQKE